VTLVVPAAEGQPFTVTVTVYVPDAAVVGVAIEGLDVNAVKLLGPFQEYVAPGTEGVERLSVDPAHTGLLLLAAGAAACGMTTTVVVPAAEEQPLAVAITE
jgi:hypothetical protein